MHISLNIKHRSKGHQTPTGHFSSLLSLHTHTHTHQIDQKTDTTVARLGAVDAGAMNYEEF